MHPFFEPLTDREAMLLLTTLTVGGSDETGIFQFLPSDASGRLQQKAQALLEIPTDKRVPFMVKQMKQAMSFKGLRGVEKVDPSWILKGMRGESPRTVAVILISLPPQSVRSVLKRLPPGIRKNLPPKDEVKRVPVELVRAVRQIFESRFHAMPGGTVGKTFAFRDLIHLERKELYRLLRDQGLIELGQAFVAVGKYALAELCRRLPRKKAEELIQAVRNASQVDPPDLKSAQRFLSRVVVNFTDTEEFFHNAGIWRFAKASLPESPEFRAAFQQRIPREAGELFETFVEKAGELEELNEEILRRLQDMILVRIVELSQQGALNASWAQLETVYHNPTFVEQLKAAAAPVDGDIPPPPGDDDDDPPGI